MFYRRRRKAPSRRATKHYRTYKELAREIIHERLTHFNQSYDLTYSRVAIKNQKTCWGSCSEHGNLNFNYKIIFLPQKLMDYIIVHELCHLKYLNHSNDFWGLVALQMPDYRERRAHLRKMTHVPSDGFPSSVYSNSKMNKY